MKEYIEREAIIPALEDYYEPINPDFPMTLKLSQISEVLQNMPVADVAPVRHGHWNGINPTVLLPGTNWVCRCSLCGCPQDYKHNYCPNCGALMDGKWEGKEGQNTAVLPRKLYQCNRRQCGARCSWPTCRHTADRAYAVRPDAPEEDFETMGGYLWQKIEEEA